MANRTLNTRIKLRYDSYQNWYDKNPELLAGELAVAYIESGDTQEVNSVAAPQVLFKVGPGYFNDLPWASGKAADVYSWAKAAVKPSYTKAEIGLGNVRDVEQYSKGEVDELIEGIRGDLETDTNTTYRFATEKNKIIFYSTEKGGSESQVAAFEVDLSDVENAISNCYTKNEIDNKGFLVASDIAGKAEKTYVDEELAKKADLSYVNEELAKKVALEDYNNKMNGLDNTIAGINESIEGIEGDIEGINGEIEGINGSIQGINTTLSGKADQSYVDEKLAEKADKTDLDNYYNKDAIDGQVNGLDQRITANANAIEALTNGASTEEIDSVMELVEYVNEHGTEVQGMKDGIKANADAIAVEKGRVDGIVADYLTSSDKTGLENAIGVERERVDALVNTTIPGLDSRLQAVEGKPFDTYATKSEVEAVDGKADGIDARLQVVEGDYLKGSDKTNLENAIAGQKERIDDLVNTTVPGLDGRIQVLEGKPFDTYATKAEVEVVDGKANGIDSRLQAVESDYLKDADKVALNNAIAAEKERAEAAELALSNRVKAVEDNYLSSKDVIIWDCGGAN